jgi:hypothetical protein
MTYSLTFIVDRDNEPAPCPNCEESHASKESHTCPFLEVGIPNDTYTKCFCCESCEDSCAMEI